MRLAIVATLLIATAAPAVSAQRGARGVARPRAAPKAPVANRVAKHDEARRALKRPRPPAPRPVAKNRGALATLAGLAEGQTIPLVDPTTGRLDRKAEIVELGTDRWSKTPHAWVRFSNSLELRYAAEHLQLVGKPLAVQRKYLKERRQELFTAIERYTGQSTEGIRIRTLRGRNWGPRKRPRKNGPILGAFLSARGGPLDPNDAVEGFERNHTAYLSRHYSAFDQATATHEVLHAMSEPFLQAGRNAGMLTLVEGLTDYFAFEIARPHYGAEPDPAHAYYDYYRFGQHVAKTLGDKTTKSLFFSKGGDGIQKMIERYDRAVGKNGALAERIRALDQGRLVFADSGPSIAE